MFAKHRKEIQNGVICKNIIRKPSVTGEKHWLKEQQMFSIMCYLVLLTLEYKIQLTNVRTLRWKIILLFFIFQVFTEIKQY